MADTNFALSRPSRRVEMTVVLSGNTIEPARFPDIRSSVDIAVAQVFGVAQHEICFPTRGHRHAAHARQVAMYVTHISCGINLTEVGTIYGRDRTTVAYACALVEDRRDDPIFDRALELLEWIVRELLERMGCHSRRPGH
jgi:hypothetical protein